MIKQKILLVLFILLVSSVCLSLLVSSTAHEEKPLEELITHLEQRIPDLMNGYNIPGVAITWLKVAKQPGLKHTAMPILKKSEY